MTAATQLTKGSKATLRRSPKLRWTPPTSTLNLPPRAQHEIEDAGPESQVWPAAAMSVLPSSSHFLARRSSVALLSPSEALGIALW